MTTQAALNFDAERPETALGAPQTPSDGRQPYLAARTWLLGRLLKGPVSTLELRRDPWPASLNPAERVRELRMRQHDIRTERVGRGWWYQLWIDGEPVGRLPK